MPTNINIQNATSENLELQTGVQPTLSSDYWGISSNTAPSGFTRVLWMDRDVGITKGDTWIFTTSYAFAGVAVQLLESLTGTATRSDITIRIIAGTRDSGWSGEDTSVQFTGSDGNTYQVNGGRALNSQVHACCRYNACASTEFEEEPINDYRTATLADSRL
jgi:hypothetical protein